MRYLGGKSRTRMAISSYLESVRAPGQLYVEPFVGAGWVLQEMSGQRAASDVNAALVSMYQAIQRGWDPPEDVSREMYDAVRAVNDPGDPMTAFCAIGCSYGGRWWGGFAAPDTRRRPGTRSEAGRTRRALLRQRHRMLGVEFRACAYSDLSPSGALVYCDPPYQGTTGYGTGPFDHAVFWETVRRWSLNNTVVVSEYSAPEDFECVASFPMSLGLRPSAGGQGRTERLWRVRVAA